jgi:hypothetical protein
MLHVQDGFGHWVDVQQLGVSVVGKHDNYTVDTEYGIAYIL